MKETQDHKRELAADKADVYVAGLPPSADGKAVKHYFESFGGVLRVGFHTSADSNPNCSTKKKFFFKVSMDGREALERVLATDRHILLGRRLFCQEYRTGQQLARHILEISSRRVIVKRVPEWLSEHALRFLLEKRAGEVETIYEFKSDRTEPSPERRKFKSYSITFIDPSSADLIADLSPMHIRPRISILIERYDPKMSSATSAKRTRTGRGQPVHAGGCELNPKLQTSTVAGRTSAVISSESGYQCHMLNANRSSKEATGQPASRADMTARRQTSPRCSLTRHHVKPTQTSYYSTSSSHNSARDYSRKVRATNLDAANPQALFQNHLYRLNVLLRSAL